MEHFVLIFRLSTFFCILFSTFYFIQLHYFIIILVFFLHTHFQCPLHPLPISIKPPPPTPKVTWKPGYFSLFWFWCFHFTNTTCIETLHRPICLFFLISEYNFFFKWVLNSPHEPATYAQRCILSFYWSNQHLILFVMFSRCFYTRVARVWAGSFRLAYAPACVAVFGVQTPLSCLSCARVCVCLRFTWHLHVVGVCFEADSSRLSCDIYTGKKTRHGNLWSGRSKVEGVCVVKRGWGGE